MEKKQELNISLSPDMGEGTYSNLAIISHSPSEFILDFAQIAPGLPNNSAVVRRRIYLAPMHAKRLLMALSDNIRKYENNFGPIDTPQPDDRAGTIPFNIDPQGNA